MSKAKILLIDNDPQTALTLFPALAREGYDTLLATDGAWGRELVQHRRLNLILLEIALSKTDGLAELIRSKRIPVIVLSARSSAGGKARALRHGADDYATKPFDIEEVLAQIEAVLRRSSHPPPPLGDPVDTATDPEETYSFGDVTVDPALRLVQKRGHTVELTPREFDVLLYLLRSRDRVASDEMIVRAVWPRPPRAPLRGRGRSSTVTNIVRGLRRKLEDDARAPHHIVTVRGSGYRIVRARRQKLVG